MTIINDTPSLNGSYLGKVDPRIRYMLYIRFELSRSTNPLSDRR